MLVAAPALADSGNDLAVHPPGPNPAPITSAAIDPARLRIPLPDRRKWQPLVTAAAQRQGLPPAFLDRVLWQESQYFALARSRVGAQGLAQFMPGTAADRQLADPYDPQLAIPAAAAYLADLVRRFGRLSLAAAAYNAGPQRVARWRAGETDLPAETLRYVLAVTGEDLGAAVGLSHARNESASNGNKVQAGTKLASEADLCALLSTADRPCRVQKRY